VINNDELYDNFDSIVSEEDETIQSGPALDDIENVSEAEDDMELEDISEEETRERAPLKSQSEVFKKYKDLGDRIGKHLGGKGRKLKNEKKKIVSDWRESVPKDKPRKKIVRTAFVRPKAMQTDEDVQNMEQKLDQEFRNVTGRYFCYEDLDRLRLMVGKLPFTNSIQKLRDFRRDHLVRVAVLAVTINRLVTDELSRESVKNLKVKFGDLFDPREIIEALSSTGIAKNNVVQKFFEWLRQEDSVLRQAVKEQLAIVISDQHQTFILSKIRNSNPNILKWLGTIAGSKWTIKELSGMDALKNIDSSPMKKERKEIFGIKISRQQRIKQGRILQCIDQGAYWLAYRGFLHSNNDRNWQIYMQMCQDLYSADIKDCNRQNKVQLMSNLDFIRKRLREHGWHEDTRDSAKFWGLTQSTYDDYQMGKGGGYDPVKWQNDHNASVTDHPDYRNPDFPELVKRSAPLLNSYSQSQEYSTCLAENVLSAGPVPIGGRVTTFVQPHIGWKSSSVPSTHRRS